MLIRALLTILNELVDGSAEQAAWLLNPQDPGLLRSLDTLSAAQASAVPSSGGASIAAHVDHLRYGLELLNRWSRGEEPFADADYSASWRRVSVTDAEWESRRQDLARETYAWQSALRQPRERDETALTGVIASIVHLGYHLGAIRQIDRSMRGPAARD